MSEILIRSRRCESGVLFERTYGRATGKLGRQKRMRKLESEDLPFVTVCSKLREITDRIEACLVIPNYLLSLQVCYECRFTVWEAVDAAFFHL